MNKLPAAAKLEMLMELLKRKEVHECDKCSHTHEVELGILTPEEIKGLLLNEEKTKPS